ncbi:MAG: transposase, partial [Syntrophobacterales bacterium]|nr:transposase [Syntrophobacterales bacterium]
MTVRPVTRLEPLDLKGKAVTADAMHTQRKLARFLVEDKHADYYFTVKDNQRSLHNVPFCPISASGSNF